MNLKTFSVNLILDLFLVSLVIAQPSLDKFRSDMENKVRGLAQEMSKIYGELCTSTVQACEVKSFNGCQGTSQRMCYDDFSKPQDCVSEGSSLSITSTISFVKETDPNNLNQEEKVFMCASALLQNKFVEIGKQRNKQFTFSYIGTKTGSLRLYPSFKNQDKCKFYDPRVRPWYVTATSGSKNVILLIDISGSMHGSRLQIAKQAAKRVINTLSNNDFVGVISFSDQAKFLNDRTYLTRADSITKENLLSEINRLQTGGQTNYKSAFEKGLFLLNKTISDEYGSSCKDSENIFLFLTDGQPTTPKQYTTTSSLNSIINELKGSISLRIFTYGLGSGINTKILKGISCEFSGIATTISDHQDSELPKKMQNYYTFIAEGVTIETPVWTEPYDDAFGFGRIVSVSYPIYYKDNQNKTMRMILGVASIDVVLSTFEQFGLSSQEQIIKQLIFNLPCHQSDLDECELENLREQVNKCNKQQCESSPLISCPINLKQSSLYLQPIEIDQNRCCGLLISDLIVLVVVLGIAACFFSFCTYCLCCKRNGGNKQNGVNNENGEQMMGSTQNIQKDTKIENSGKIEKFNQKYPSPYQNSGKPYGKADEYIR